jgi:hypothetical protein
VGNAHDPSARSLARHQRWQESNNEQF